MQLERSLILDMPMQEANNLIATTNNLYSSLQHVRLGKWHTHTQENREYIYIRVCLCMSIFVEIYRPEDRQIALQTKST